MKKRYFKKRDAKLPKGYDSKLELRLHETALQDAQHHVTKEDLISYVIPHTYEPDFIFELGEYMYVVECKGRFRDSSEASKYNHIAGYIYDWEMFIESPCSYGELFFIFENAATPYPFAKRRRDGTKMTHGEWATKNKFRWLCEKRGDLEGISTKQDLVNALDNLNSNH
jgi:hypothetical protein